MNFKATHILLADDDEDDRMFFSDVLKDISSAIKLTTAHDGDHLMQLLKKLGSLPDLIFLDLNMPVKNGYECLREIRQNPYLKRLPVVVLSTTSQEESVQKVYEGGADLYVCKPTAENILNKIIQRILSINWLEQLRPSREEFVLCLSN